MASESDRAGFKPSITACWLLNPWPVSYPCSSVCPLWHRDNTGCDEETEASEDLKQSNFNSGNLLHRRWQSWEAIRAGRSNSEISRKTTVGWRAHGGGSVTAAQGLGHQGGAGVRALAGMLPVQGGRRKNTPASPFPPTIQPPAIALRG